MSRRDHYDQPMINLLTFIQYTFKSNQINLHLFDGKSTTCVTDAKVVYGILLGGQ